MSRCDKPTKVREDAQPDRLTLLGVKLGREDVAPPDAGDELRVAIVGGGGDDLWIVRRRIVGMDKIGRSAVGDALQKGSTALDVQLVPAHVWNLPAVECRRVKTDDPPLEDIEPAHAAELHALREKDLHTHADAEQRRAVRDDMVNSVHQTALGQTVQAGSKRAYSGQHHTSSGFNAPSVACDLRHVPHSLEALLHTAQIPHAVVNDGNHKRSHDPAAARKNQLLGDLSGQP